MRRRSAAVALTLAFTLVLRVPSALGRADTPRLPFVLQGDESVATTDDARALLYNPAAAGLRYPFELLEDFRRHDPHDEWNATLLASRHLGFYALRQRDSSQTYGFNVTSGSGSLRWGVSPYWLVSGQPRRERVVDWRIGLLSRPAPWLSAGFTADRLFQPFFRGERRARHYTLGLGLRPLAMSREHAAGWGTRLTFSGDVQLVDDGQWRQARSWVGAELEPVPGLAFELTLADHRNLRLGLTLRGVRWGAHVVGASEEGRAIYQGYALSVHGGDERSVFAGPGERRIAVVRAAGTLADESMGGVALMGGAATVAAAPLHRQLERALEDPLTRGVLLDLHGVNGMAQVEELRPRIAALRAAGKPVVAYMEEGGGRADLYLAGACDRIVASEEADFMALGLRAEQRYWRDALARIGIRVERSSTGAYKSAYRNLSVDGMPPADSEAVQHALDVRQKLFADALDADRHLAPGRLATYLDGRAWSPADLAAGGVIDSVGYREDALRIAGRLAGLSATPRTVDLRRTPVAHRQWMRPARLAVVYAGGGIELGRSGNDLLTGATLGSATLIAELERAFKAPGVRAVVLRIESPGGSALASNLVDHAVQKLKRETGKPFIVSMGALAGSGGYYIACHADRIFADRYTRTGSIGVLTIQPSFEGLYGKLHARQVEFDRGAYMRGASWSRDWTPREQAAADSTIQRLYRGFVGKVAEGRHMTPGAVDAVAQGRVWMGDDARERGLVDAIGGLDDALREARARGGIPAGESIRLYEQGRPRGSFLARLVGGWVRETLAREARLPDFGSAQMVDPAALGPLAE